LSLIEVSSASTPPGVASRNDRARALELQIIEAAAAGLVEREFPGRCRLQGPAAAAPMREAKTKRGLEKKEKDPRPAVEGEMWLLPGEDPMGVSRRP
jgi:hypothetical protein